MSGLSSRLQRMFRVETMETGIAAAGLLWFRPGDHARQEWQLLDEARRWLVLVSGCWKLSTDGAADSFCSCITCSGVIVPPVPSLAGGLRKGSRTAGLSCRSAGRRVLVRQRRCLR